MTLALTANLVTSLLCLAVLVQSVRMMRGIVRMERLGLRDNVTAIERATTAAQHILSDFKTVLCDQNTRISAQVDEAARLCDELSTLIKLADARASQIAGVPAPATANATAAPQPAAARQSGYDILQRWKRAAQSQQQERLQ